MDIRKCIALISMIPLIIILACGTQKEAPKNISDLELLLSYMTGSFSSQEQAAADSSFLDIRLEMVPIWKERSDAHWLYVEQATAATPDSPYRQRVYRVSQVDDSTFESAVYTIEEPLRFAGDWKKEIPLEHLTPDSLSLREGCTIVLRKVDDKFVGSTVGTGCESTLRGAAYATSEVVIASDHMRSWDRGFDADGNQVWGAETGGYVFRKIEKNPE